MPGFKNMTREERRDYLRAYRKRWKKCACGRLATLLKWGERVCERCNALENERDKKESHRKVGGGLSEYRLCLPRGCDIREP
jgi:hypothetical protein